MLPAVFRYVHLAKGLRPIQPYWRLRQSLRYALYHRGFTPPAYTRVWRETHFITLDAPSLRRLFARFADTERAREIRTGKMTFFHHTEPFSPPRWDLGFTKLWRYMLHAFDYAIDLAAAGAAGDAASEEFLWDLVCGWLRANPPVRGEGWEPYPVSLRIVNLLKAGVILRAMPEEIAGAVWLQARFLERHLEWDLFGNHIIKNAKALAFAGCLLTAPEAARWRARARDILTREVERQVLPDGGHEERSLSYHKIVLQDLLETAALFTAHGEPPPTAWHAAIRRMSRFLSALLHPDGEVPLFNDSAFNVGPPADVLLDALTETGMLERRSMTSLRCEAFSDSGYFAARDSASYVVIDCGPIGPDHLPAHGHCDCLSFELSLDGARVIVDTGVFDYEAGPRRAYARSTAAHNTVRLDGREQSDLWGSFRAGRRARPLWASLSRQEEWWVFDGAHDGYRPIGFVHRRTGWFGEGGRWIVLDTLIGRHAVSAESFVHLHPRWSVDLAVPAIRLRCGREELVLRLLGTCRAEAMDTEYYSEQGLVRIRRTIRLTADAAACPRFGYALLRPEDDAELADGGVRVRAAGRETLLAVPERRNT